MRARVLPLTALAAILFAVTTASAADPTCNGQPPSEGCRVDGHVGTCIAPSDGLPHRILGKRGPAVIIGGDGDDDIRGRTGADTICGGGGNDTIKPGPGDDYVDGGPGDDKIYGSYGIDEILCGNGDDTSDGGKGEDTCGTGCEVSSRCEESVEEGCTSDADCASGEFCHVGSGECRAQNGDCTVDGDCVNGQVCNTATTKCTSCIDNDGDSYGVGCTLGDDCNDGNDAINPAATEVCDTVDNDCDGSTDEGFDLRFDANNCGTCGTTCGGDTPYCSLGVCHAQCAFSPDSGAACIAYLKMTDDVAGYECAVYQCPDAADYCGTNAAAQGDCLVPSYNEVCAAHLNACTKCATLACP